MTREEAEALIKDLPPLEDPLIKWQREANEDEARFEAAREARRRQEARERRAADRSADDARLLESKDVSAPSIRYVEARRCPSMGPRLGSASSRPPVLLLGRTERPGPTSPEGLAGLAEARQGCAGRPAAGGDCPGSAKAMGEPRKPLEPLGQMDLVWSPVTSAGRQAES